MDYMTIREKLINEVLSKKEGLTAAEITEIITGGTPTSLNQEEETTFRRMVSLIKSVLKQEAEDTESPIIVCAKKKRGTKQYKLRAARVPGPTSKEKPNTDTSDTNYIGRAGEFSVLTELIARGYNANNMTIDEGIDIVASKDNIFYYIQVKTTYFDQNNRIAVHIATSSFDRVKTNNVIYIIAIRESIGRFRYFIFHQTDIDNLRIGGYVERTEANINIKIAYDNANEPYLYNDKKTTSAKPYMAEIKGFKL